MHRRAVRRKKHINF